MELKRTGGFSPFTKLEVNLQIVLLLISTALVGQVEFCEGLKSGSELPSSNSDFKEHNEINDFGQSLIQNEQRLISRFRQPPMFNSNGQGFSPSSDYFATSLVPAHLINFLKNESSKVEFFNKLKNHLNPTQDDEEGADCVTHFTLLLNTIFESISNLTHIRDPKNTWAFQMVDSWGKLPEGMLSGHVNSYGDYDECVGVEVDDDRGTSDGGGNAKFSGQYCWTYIIPGGLAAKEGGQVKSDYNDDGRISTRKAGSVEDLLYYMLHPTAVMVLPSSAYCIPSTCSMDQFQVAVSLLFMEIFPNTTPFVAFCQLKEDRTLTTDAKVMIGVLGVLGCFILAGTILDVVLNGAFVKTKPDKFHTTKKQLPTRLLLAFSLPTNIAKWANTSGGGGFGCIHGIRFMSTCWVVLSHTIFVVTMQGPTWNTIDVTTIYQRPWHFYFILNAYFSVDTFFTMSGLLACYSIMKELDKSKGQINVLKLYLHRYLRLTPTYALIIGVIACLFPYLSSGPFFTLTADGISKACRKYWWHNLLYFNNVYRYDAGESMCEAESWYIANDMQFFILSPLFAFLLWKWNMIGIAVLGCASLASIVAPGIVIGTEGLPPTQVFWKMGSSPNPRALEVYMHPWYRIGPYLVGMWMGYLLFKIGKKPVHLPRLAVLGGWMLSTATSLALILGVIPYFDPENNDSKIAAGIYGGLSRFCWGMVICWVIFACVKGYGGWINDMLSWKAWIPLGRLTFCVYLSSLSVQMMLQLSLRQPMNFDMYTVVNMFFSHLIMCFIVGFGLSMIFESPFIALEKVFMSAPPREKALPVTNGEITTQKTS